jgi:hypothetical protein
LEKVSLRGGLFLEEQSTFGLDCTPAKIKSEKNISKVISSVEVEGYIKTYFSVQRSKILF